jgi:hypothetical protein
MEKKVKVNKKTAKLIKKKVHEQKTKELLKKYLTFVKSTKPVVVEGKEVLLKGADERKVIWEVFNTSLVEYANLWKKLATTLDNPPDGVDDIYKALSQGNVMQFDDTQIVEDVTTYVTELGSMIQKIKEIKDKMEVADRKMADFLKDTKSGSDLIADEEESFDEDNEKDELSKNKAF